MGLMETVNSGIAAGMAAVGNIQEALTYLAYNASSSYAPTTGIYTRVETSYSTLGMFYDYKKREIDGQLIKPHDQQLLIEQAVLPVRPTLQDRVLQSNGKYWEVLGVQDEPSHSVWILQVRGTNG